MINIDELRSAVEAAGLNAISREEVLELLDRLSAAEKAVTEAYRRGYATGREEIEMERAALRAKITEMEKQEPVFWWRQCSDETYEGPIHNNSIERVRKQSGAWSPLYALPGAKGEEK